MDGGMGMWFQCVSIEAEMFSCLVLQRRVGDAPHQDAALTKQ
jgi:hypothetical protein